MRRTAMSQLAGLVLALAVTTGPHTAWAQPERPHEPSRPARQIKFHVHIDGVSAVQLSWWFQHMGDGGGKYWLPLAPENQQIKWIVDPAEDAHQIIGSVFESDQHIEGGLFKGDNFHMQVQFEDYITQNRFFPRGQPRPLDPALPVPADYTPSYPSPLPQDMPGSGGGSAAPPTPAVNGFNEDMVMIDGLGFAPGRLLFSWVNTGDDDTPATAGQPKGVDLYATYYLPWMEGGNRPTTMAADGYYYNDRQIAAIWSVWQKMLANMPAQLPGFFNTNTQDDLARLKGFTVTENIDTGHDPGVTAKMETWWWNHAMGDAPGNAYVFWCPPFHHSIRWLPGYSPEEVAHTRDLPEDHPVVGAIYPDLQGPSLEQTGGGMMSYPVSMSPVPGVFKVVDVMMIISAAEVANLGKVRFPKKPVWLVHQWEDTPQGLVHRSQLFHQLPLREPVTQQEFVSEHQSFEGLFLATGRLPKLYEAWVRQQGSR